MWLGDSAGEAKPLLARIDLTPVIGVIGALLAVTILRLPPQTNVVNLPITPVEALPGPDAPQAIELQLDLGGNLTWNGIALLPGEFESHLGALERQNHHPELRLRAPAQMKFEYLADTAATAQRHHMHLGLGTM